MTYFKEIDHKTLDHVHGGDRIEIGGGVQVPDAIDAHAQAALDLENYQACVRAVSGMPGAVPHDILTTCGLPPRQPPRTPPPAPRPAAPPSNGRNSIVGGSATGRR